MYSEYTPGVVRSERGKSVKQSLWPGVCVWVERDEVCHSSGPKWTEVKRVQKWTEVCYFRSTSGTSLRPADREGGRSGPEVGHFTYETLVLYSHIRYRNIIYRSTSPWEHPILVTQATNLSSLSHTRRTLLTAPLDDRTVRYRRRIRSEVKLEGRPMR